LVVSLTSGQIFGPLLKKWWSLSDGDITILWIIHKVVVPKRPKQLVVTYMVGGRRKKHESFFIKKNPLSRPNETDK